jgi:NADH:ubiquinone oxidoreductase subunit 3 (subunit A)
MTIQLTSILIVLGLFIMAKKVSAYRMEKKSLKSPFECGFLGLPSRRIPFSIQFFLISILFLIFDVEISVITPFPMEPGLRKNKTIMIMFLIVLSGGLFYEWVSGKMEWFKWMIRAFFARWPWFIKSCSKHFMHSS